MTYSKPEPQHPDYESDSRWKSSNMAEHNLAWLQVQLPQADFTTWTSEEVEAFKSITANHCCSVCGRWDDDGCIEGC